MAEEFIFPVLKPTDIITDLESWKIPVSMELLKKPTSDWVCLVYGAFLQHVTGIDLDSLHEPTQNALNTLEDPKYDIYAAALSQNILLYHMCRLAEYARITDFSAKDLHQPDSERTTAILSGFLNFIKFMGDCQPVISELQDESIQIVEDRDGVADELAQLQAKLAEAKAQMALDEPQCIELRKENVAITAHLVAIKDIQTTRLTDIARLKEERSVLMKRQEALNQEIVMTTDSVSRTRSRVVQSPERIKRTIVTMGSTAIEDKRTVAVHEAKARDLQAKITALLNIEKDIRTCVEQLQTIEKETSLLETAQKELADLKDHLDRKDIERNELQLKQDRVTKQLYNAQEKLDRAQKHGEDKRLASQQTIERLQREYEEMALERRDNDKQMEELRKEADDVVAKTIEHHKKSEAELNELLTEYWRLRHETEVYMEILANKLKLKVSSE